MKSVEEAYADIAKSTFNFVHGRQWECAISFIEILNMSENIQQRLVCKGAIDGKGDQFYVNEALDAAVFLKDNILQTTGKRIWGLTFTLYPDGKFNIEYDYNKPEGYEDSGEVITGEEINASLAQLMQPKGST